MKILITGAAGFIGFHLTKRLIEENIEIVGLDSVNDYYDAQLKFDRLHDLGLNNKELQYNKALQSSNPNFKFIKLNLEDQENINILFKNENFDYVVNLAAQAGVRYSIDHPETYIQANIIGFFNVIEACRHNNIKHLVYASSSSVYGLNKEVPFSEKQKVDNPISLYAASKKSNELIAHTYSHLFDLKTSGLRFFTVYGPWGRPDMALFKFTKNILEGKIIEVYNNGKMKRDFTYVDDIVKGIVNILNRVEKKIGGTYEIYNIGNGNPENLMDFVKAIEENLGKKADINFKPMQPGDVKMTYADTKKLKKHFDYQPKTSIREGIKNFIDWYKEYYG